MEHRVVLSGSIGFIGLGEILQVLSSNAATGILRLRSKYATEPGSFHFSGGNLINAQAPGKIGLQAAYSLFGWQEAEFDFTTQEPQTEALIQAGVMEIVLDGLRMLDDGQVEILGPRQECKTDAGVPCDDFGYLPVIRRPVSNYGYVVNEEEVPNGQVIVKEGGFGSWISVILDGYADVVRETPKGPFRVARLGPGALVGNITSILTQSSVRTASLLAVGNTVLGILDLPRIHAEFSVLSYELKHLAISLDKRLKETTNRVVESFLGEDGISSAIKGMKVMFPEGIDEEGLYRISSGCAVVARNTAKGLKPLVRLGKGDFIGEFPLANIGHEVRHATVYASADCNVSGMDVFSLTHEYEQVSPIIKQIIDHVATSISVTTSLACDPSKLEKHAKALEHIGKAQPSPSGDDD
jgi:CRP-like cAMP-binding protein